MVEPFSGHRIAATSELARAQATMTQDARSRVVLQQLGADVPLEAKVNVFCLGQSRVCYLKFGAAVRISMLGGPDYRVLIPLEGHAGVRVSGRRTLRVNPHAGIVVSTETGLEMVCGGGYAHLAVTFPRDLVHRELERLTGRPVDAPVEFADSIDLTTAASSLWRHLLRAIGASAHQANGLLPGGIPSRRLERRLLTLLLTEQPHSYSRDLHRPRTSVAQRAIDIIEERPDHRWAVEELAAAVWCSARTLQANFQKTVGVTPTEYVRWVRLQRVHDELEGATSSQATVTDVATSWGFAHMGRFSAAYREEFQEYPHETLRASHRSRDASLG